MNDYQTLPKPPEQITAGTILSRLVDSIGFRFRIATEELTDNEVHFRPVESSMSILEVSKHIYGLVYWSHKTFATEIEYNKNLQTFDDYRAEILKTCYQFREKLMSLSKEEVEKTTIYLKRTDTRYPIWYLINGPLADALTHIGQINTWRRIAGNPCPKISPFTGE